ncbi:hypothetical protein J3459_007484 [Metarhizium acridum]|nr:hypothetical protein J3459_007484 [Metarhizium acridum]
MSRGPPPQITVNVHTHQHHSRVQSNSHPRCWFWKSQKGYDTKKYATPTSGKSSQVPPRLESLCKSSNTQLTICCAPSAALKTHPDRVPADSQSATPAPAGSNSSRRLLQPLRCHPPQDYRRPAQALPAFSRGSEPLRRSRRGDSTSAGSHRPGRILVGLELLQQPCRRDREHRERERTEDAQFSDVFEEMMREEGMAEEGSSAPTSKFWSLIGGLSGAALGFIIANFPGMLAGAVAGNRLGAVRDAKGKSVYEVYSALPQDDRARLLSQLATRVFSHVAGI